MTTDYDLSSLNLTAEPEAVEPEAYTPPYDTNTGAIDTGTYMAKFAQGSFKGSSPDEKLDVQFGSATCKKNGKTYLAARFSVEVSGAKKQGKDVANRRIYGRVDLIPEGMRFQNVRPGRENATSFADLLIASGWTGSLRSNDDYKNALLSLIEKEAALKVRVTKSAYSNPKSTEYAGSGLSWRGDDEINAHLVTDEQGNVDYDHVYSPGSYDGQPPIIPVQNEIRNFYPIKK